MVEVYRGKSKSKFKAKSKFNTLLDSYAIKV